MKNILVFVIFFFFMSITSHAQTTCDGDYSFLSTVWIYSTTGETWTISVTNDLFYDPNTLLPFSVGTSFVETPPGSGNYQLTGKFYSDEEYALENTCPDYPGLILHISDERWYAIPEITGLDTIYLTTDISVLLVGEAQLGDGTGSATADSISFTIDGVVSTHFDPNNLEEGSHEVIFTFDPEDNDPTDKHPGCLVYDTMIVEVMAPPFPHASSNTPIFIGSSNNQPHSSAILELKSTEKGLLFPRMTQTEFLAILSPTEGLVVYSLTHHMLVIYNGTVWKKSDGTDI